MRRNLTKCYSLVVILIYDMKGCSENIWLSAWYIFILTPNVAAHISKAAFPDKVSSWVVILIRCTCTYKLNPLKWSTITWAYQMNALMSLPDNCVNNTGWYYWIWYTDNTSPELLSVSFLMDPDLFCFVIHLILLYVPNMYDSQRGISSFKSINIDGRTQSFASLNMYLGCRLDNL